MSQYFVICNIDRKEYIDPHSFGESSKFNSGWIKTMEFLAILLADNPGSTDHEWSGRWAKDRIVVAGDYASPENFYLQSLENDEWEELL